MKAKVTSQLTLWDLRIVNIIYMQGDLADPGYGLRLDGILDGNSSKIYTFDFDDAQSDVKMAWDGTTISIFGAVWGGRDTGSTYGGAGVDAARLWDLDFIYNVGATESASGVKVSGTDKQNFGSLESDLGLFDLTDVGNATHSYTFQLGNHRGFDGISGWGWLNHCLSDDNVGSIGGVSGADYAASTILSGPASIKLAGCR